MPTFKEQIASLTAAKHRLAVWEMLYAHLDSNYVPKDSGTVQKAIRVADCPVDIVPSEVIEGVLQELSDGPIKDLHDEIVEVEGQEVVLPRKAGSE